MDNCVICSLFPLSDDRARHTAQAVPSFLHDTVHTGLTFHSVLYI